MPFFSKLQQGTQTKNKLEKAVYDMIQNYERKIIQDDELAAFKKEITTNIKNLNALHARCKPVKTDWYEDSNSNRMNDHNLWLYFVNIVIYQSK
jgi:hypothetical protein